MLNLQHSAVKDGDLSSLLGTLIGARAARRILATVAGDGLAAIRGASVREIVSTYGLTERAAERTRAAVLLANAIHAAPFKRGEAFCSSEDAYRAFSWMRDLRVEQFHAVLLDGKHRVIRDVLVSQGTLTSSPVHPREVFKVAIRESAAAVVFVHNHPSGDPSPSGDDLDVTRRLSEVGDLVGIQVLDHVVIGDGRYVSFADRGLLR